jgi:NADPH:quinone reductase-like Zn-dependent oxidoreductase
MSAMALPTSAKVLKFEKNGTPTDVLKLTEVPLKECGATDVLVKMLGAPVNPR